MALRLPELIVIFVVALLIFGPKKLPEMGAQIGRSLNAFRKGMSEFRHPIDDTFDSDSFMARHREITRLEARRLELEILERELAVKRAEAALRATQSGIPPYSSETTVDEDYVESEAIVDADDVTPEKRVHTPAEPIKTTESEKVTHGSPGVSAHVESEKEARVAPTVSVPADSGKEARVTPNVSVPADSGKEAHVTPSVSTPAE